MNWHVSHRFDRRALPLADRHYNRQKPGTPQFVAPGEPLVLLTADASALWVSLRQKPEYAKHAWPGAWVNTHFRNESPVLSSLLIREAVAATCAEFGQVPGHGMVTFIDVTKVRRKRDPGRCYLRAGFKRLKETTKQHDLIVLQLLEMPSPEPAIGAQLCLVKT